MSRFDFMSEYLKELEKRYNDGEISLSEKTRLHTEYVSSKKETQEKLNSKPKNNIIDKPELDVFEVKTSFKDENTLKTVANIVLVLGVISAIILFITGVFVEIDGESEIDMLGLVPVFTTLLFSVGAWSFFTVISNISITLKESNKR